MKLTMLPPAKAEFWHTEKGGFVVCDLCPHACRLAEGRSGLCKVRRNEEGKLRLPYYGLLSALALDPIEKKPLHHFMPGSSVFSAGFVGCNLRCPFCQNWHISQEVPPEFEAMTPEGLASAALSSGAPSIAYTYSEPCVHFEYVRDSMHASRSLGLKNVLITNGCLDPEPARELLGLTDAVNIDLKTWSASVYAKELGGNKDAVLEFIRLAAGLCLVEVTTLVVPGLSDDADGMASIAEFLASISPDIPLHLSAYHPAWKYEEPSTNNEALLELSRICQKRLDYVYIGNVLGQGSDTICPNCKTKLIARQGYQTKILAIEKKDSRAFCSYCGSALHIIV
jgi:pyruvate formate lyase activating enzyme